MSAICVFNITKVILTVGLTRCSPRLTAGMLRPRPPGDRPRGVLPLGLLRQWAEVDLLPGGRAKAESEKVPLGEITLESSWWLSQSSSASSMPLMPSSSS